jgi:hypothetical protein
MDSNLSDFEIIRRGATRSPASWVGVVSTIEPVDAIVDELSMEAVAQRLPVFDVIDVRDFEPFALGQELQSHGNASVLLKGFDAWEPRRWRNAELNRNTWLRDDGVTWFLLGPLATANLSIYAPNVRSLLGPYLILGPDQSVMSAENRESRLTDLREYYGKTDQDIVATAQDGTLELSPHMVEWLVLLDRGDLL